MDFVTVDVRDKVTELIKLVLRDEDVPDSVVDKAVRMLRQADDTHGEHSGAIKQRIRQSILNHAVAGSNGPALVSKFEKECYNLGTMGSPLLRPFLAVMEPLSHSLTQLNVLGPKINIINESETFNRNENSSGSSTDAISTGLRTQRNTGTKSELPSMSYAIAGGLLPIVPPYHTSGVDVDSSEATMAWISSDVENLLLKDLIYIFQGIGGRYIKYDPQSECYVIDPALNLQLTVKDTVLCLCELGWLYSKVSV